jgi:hypothetical protein
VTTFHTDPEIQFGAFTAVWHGIFAAMAEEPDFEYLILDSTIVRAHSMPLGRRGWRSGPGPLAWRLEHQDPPRCPRMPRSLIVTQPMVHNGF